MNRRYVNNKKTPKVQQFILSHIQNNIREYLIATIIFLIGIVIGVIFINNISENQNVEITNYISSFVNELKENKTIDNFAILKDSIQKNCILAIFLWFMGSTVIGISIVYLTLCFRGFCLGYTISSVILTLRYRKRNIIFILYYFFTKYFIYTMYNCSCCKWYEIT